MEFLGEFLGVGANLVLDFLGEGHRRDDARGVAGVDACGFHVFHDGAHHGVLAVADAVHVEFGGVFEEVVDEDRLTFANVGGFFHVVGDAFSFGRSRTYMCGRAILQGAPCAPAARPRRSCNGATAPPQGVTIPNANAGENATSGFQ